MTAGRAQERRALPGRALTRFEQVLLGMLVVEPRSGYRLRVLFTETPAAAYCGSPGTLYPALRRLRDRGLLQERPGISPAGRAQKVWYPTEAGRAEHLAWLREPVRADAVIQDLGIHLMRFAQMGTQLPREDVLAFLDELIGVLESLVGELGTFLDGEAASFPVTPRLALAHGIAIHQASLDWARGARAELAG